MMTRLQKWGNSLGLRIPKGVAHDAHIKEGASVDIRLHEGRLIISPVKSKKYQLDTLLKHIRPNHIHREISISAPVGNEVW